MIEAILFLYFMLARPNTPSVLGESSVALASRSFSLEDRYNIPSVNVVFKDNILLTLKYLSGDVKSKADISWDEVERPFHYEFTLESGKTFAFHDQVLPEYKDRVVKTTNAHFNFTDGFKSDGHLYGDGVCHIASLIYWAALDAGLDTVRFANHDFAKINDVPKEYGVSIKFMPGDPAGSARQNLYITNNKEKPVTFAFDYDGTNLTVSVITS